MGSQTLTLRRIVKKPSGWWNAVDSENLEWGIPPSDKFTGASNEGFVAELQSQLDQPVELDVWTKDDGSSRIIKGKPKAKFGGKGGGGRDPQEQRYMNRRTALMTMKDLIVGNGGSYTRADLVVADELYEWLERPFAGVGGGSDHAFALGNSPGMPSPSSPPTSSVAPTSAAVIRNESCACPGRNLNPPAHRPTCAQSGGSAT